MPLTLCGEVLVLLPARHGHLLARHPACHRALMMASSWERKHGYSHTEKITAFVPSLIMEQSHGSDSLMQPFYGVLFFADVSGGVSREEQPRARAPVGHSRPFGALPLPPGQSGHPGTAEVSLGCPTRAGGVILGSQPLLPPALSRGMGRGDLRALGPGSVELAAGSFGPHEHFLILGCPSYRFHCFDREVIAE